MALTPDPPPPSEALAVLQRRVRWLTAVCVFLGVGLVIDFARTLLPSVGDLSARALTIPDSTGTARIQLGLWLDQTPFVRLNGADGKERMMAYVRPDGISQLRMSDSAGVGRLFLGLDEGGAPGLYLAGPDGAWLVAVDGHGRGRYAMVVRNESRELLWKAP